MKITINEVERLTIEQFADRHGLEMVVNERPNDSWNRHKAAVDRWYARFEHAEVVEGCCLSSTHGNGATVKEAISDYARQISEKTLAINAMTPERRDIKVPQLLWKEA